ncbi:MAG TPA: type I site-specific deoxyribonuclease [Microscillaceae bacterium]|nr:type I site-specific deoxyribonuclease [Microscillaceae bacterium]
MSNFNFLQADWRNMYRQVKKGESRIKTEPPSAARYFRLVLEECVHHIYKESFLEWPFNQELASLLDEEDFKQTLPPGIHSELHYVRKMGNQASHFSSKKVKSDDALACAKYLFRLLKWFAGEYTMPLPPDTPAFFDESLIPQSTEAQQKVSALKQEHQQEQQKLQAIIDALQAEKAQAEQEAQQSKAAFEAYQAQQAEAKALHAQRRAEDVTLQAPPKIMDEAETRERLIDVALMEADWYALQQGKDLEYRVTGLPKNQDNPSGTGKADYVLWDDDGRPLAVIEAKRASADLEKGRNQAVLYADALEQMHGQRPIIFYTNGYEIALWDDAFYNLPRRVHGFYSKEQLRLLIQRRQSRGDIRLAKVNTTIVERPYQMEAIQRVAEEWAVTEKGTEKLKGKRRKALLVMATGSGKTRTAAALVEILSKNNWAKRVLFLADRKALVKQAKDSFKEHLPDLSAVNLVEEEASDTTRLVFSTYPTMMHKIDAGYKETGAFYSVGHFDLIIIDEAHRSVYNRYRTLFEYFDAMLLGLTATPKNSIDHNTYELFECPNDDPTFAYELEQAVKDGFLAPYQNLDVQTEFLRQGIRYQDLSEKEKEQYEEKFLDDATGQLPDQIEAEALNKWLFNKGTVNSVLDALMDDGLTIEGGDRLGRTIIFAANQRHADFIVECFNKRYTHLPTGFIEQIHSGLEKTQALIDRFCDHKNENLPQIAVSVDMMDTGIDAPRVLNLVFFKTVYSYAKFWQMIGRGTRLCPDVFGPGQDKAHFLIFDVGKNFEFFDVHKRGKTERVAKPLSAQIFETRLQLSQQLATTGEDENLELARDLLDQLHAEVEGLDREHFRVKMKQQHVEAYAKRDRWDNLSSDDLHAIKTHLSDLIVPEQADETTRRFELMMLKMQLAHLLELDSEATYQDKLIGTASELSKKYTVAEIKAAKDTIERVKTAEFYSEATAPQLDKVREELKSLVSLLDKESKVPIYTNFDDSEAELKQKEYTINSGLSGTLYRQRVEKFIRENKHHLTIRKLMHNEAITASEITSLEQILFDGDERGTRAEYIKAYGEQPLGKFIRGILGMTQEAAQAAFSQFLQAGNLSADQINFVNRIIEYLTKNGVIDQGKLFKSPFNTLHDQGIIGVFDHPQAQRILKVLEGINENANVG